MPRTKKLRPGLRVAVLVGGLEYETVIDEHGVQRFKKNAVYCWLVDSGRVNLNEMAAAFQRKERGRDGPMLRREYAEFIMGLGYSVSGFSELAAFQRYPISNPLWSY